MPYMSAYTGADLSHRPAHKLQHPPPSPSPLGGSERGMLGTSLTCDPVPAESAHRVHSPAMGQGRKLRPKRRDQGVTKQRKAALGLAVMKPHSPVEGLPLAPRWHKPPAETRRRKCSRPDVLTFNSGLNRPASARLASDRLNSPECDTQTGSAQSLQTTAI